MLFEWSTFWAKKCVKSMGMKRSAPVSFTRTLLVHRVQFLSSSAQNGEDGKGLKLREKKGER